jgi:hypothetical protein
LPCPSVFLALQFFFFWGKSIKAGPQLMSIWLPTLNPIKATAYFARNVDRHTCKAMESAACLIVGGCITAQDATPVYIELDFKLVASNPLAIS